MLISPEFFRLLVVGDGHAVALSPFVPTPLEFADDEIGLHLQLCDAAVEVLIALFAESRCYFFLMLTRKPPSSVTVSYLWAIGLLLPTTM